MGGFYGWIPRVLKKYGGWILTGLAAGGIVGTTVLMAKEAPEAKMAVRREEQQRILEGIRKYPAPDGIISDEDDERIIQESRLNFWEKTGIYVECCWPSMALVIFSLGCLFGAQVFNAKKQAALVAAYGALLAQFDQYREAIRAEHGEEADQRAYEFSQRQIEDLQEEIKMLKEENGPFLYGIETLPGIVFEAKPGDIHESLLHYSRNLILRGYADLDELYEMIGVPENTYDKELAQEYGFNSFIDENEFGMVFLDFGTDLIEARNGRKVHMLRFSVPPYKVVGPGDGDDNLEDYPDFEEASRKADILAASILDENVLTKVMHPRIFGSNLFLEARSQQ